MPPEHPLSPVVLLLVALLPLSSQSPCFPLHRKTTLCSYILSAVCLVSQTGIVVMGS